MRWLVVFALCAVIAAMLYPVVRFGTSREEATDLPRDEVLAYDLSPPRQVLLELPGDVEELHLTTWCVVGRAEPTDRFPYEVGLEWLDEEGVVFERDALGFESRVSDVVGATGARAWAAKLAYSDERLSDPRTLRIPVPASVRPRAVRMKSLAGRYPRVAVRATFPKARLRFEVDAVERGLNTRGREQLTENRSSLPYAELPLALRQNALSHWDRRLDASGREGIDYSVVRVLIGTGRSPPEFAPVPSPFETVSQGRALAYNVVGRVALELMGPPGRSVRVRDGVGAVPAHVLLSREGRAELDVGGEFARTVVVDGEAEEPIAVRAFLAARDVSAAVADSAVLREAERAELRPLVRRIVQYPLDPKASVSVRIAPRQRLLGIALRAAAARTRGKVELVLGAQRISFEADFTPSEFDRWLDGSVASESESYFVTVPDGVARAELLGDPWLRGTFFTLDPEVEVDVLARPYQVPLAPDDEWRLALYDVRQRVLVRSDQHDHLARSGRTVDLLAQAHIVPLGAGEVLPERLLDPSGSPVQRHLLEPALPGGEPWPRDAVSLLEGATRVRVPRGPSNRVRVEYRAEVSSLGGTAELLVNGGVARSQPLLSASGRFEFDVEPGVHTLELRGFATPPLAVVSAPREFGGPAYRRRTLSRLDPGESLEFAFTQAEERLRFVVLGVTAGAGIPWSIRYQVDGMERIPVFREPTEDSGLLHGTTAAAAQARFWEEADHAALGALRGLIRFGDDLVPGRRRVTMRNSGERTLWVRVVLVGQAAPSKRGPRRFWSREEP
jgi:hypothetical protein